MELWNQFVSLADGWKLVSLVVLAIVNLLVGVAVAFHKGEFKLSGVADILRSRIVPYFVGYYALAIAATIDSSVNFIAPVAWGIALAGFIGHILAGIKELGVWSSLPDIVAGRRQ